MMDASEPDAFDASNCEIGVGRVLYNYSRLSDYISKRSQLRQKANKNRKARQRDRQLSDVIVHDSKLCDIIIGWSEVKAIQT